MSDAQKRDEAIAAERGPLMRYVIGRELAGVDDQAKLLAALNALGVSLPAFECRVEEYTKLQQRRIRSIPVRVCPVDEHWIVKAIAAYERRGQCREGASLNGAALAGICIEWMGLGDWLGRQDEL
jgi:hypothetical protein